MACVEEVGANVALRSPALLQAAAAVQAQNDVTPRLQQALLSLRVDEVPRSYYLPEPLVHAVRALCLFTGADASDDSTAVLVSLSLVLSGGALHAVAMCMRKYFGEGHRTYWLQWRWWLGVICDGVAGALLWPAMPVITVQLLVPMCTVTQLSVGYLLGLIVFKEQATLENHAGLCFAILGVVGLGVTGQKIATAPGELSLAQWVQPAFLKALACCLAALFGTFALEMPRATSWAIAAGLAEAVQFLASRSLADVLMHSGLDLQGATSLRLVVTLVAVKLLSIVVSLHCQQLGFKAQLSRFVGIFLVSTNLLTVLLGLAFFADKVAVTVGFLSSSFATLAGIWLLNSVCQKDGEGTVLED